MEGGEVLGGAALAPEAMENTEKKMETHGEVGGALAVGSTQVSLGMMGMRKKRGRPRKYAQDGSLVLPLSLMPISTSTPGGFTLTSGESVKRGKGRPAWSKMFMRSHLDVMGDLAACSAVNFVPHIINVEAGEDITTKVMSFSQQGPRAVCILSANGVISNVTLRQPDSSGGTLTYEGRFELLSLSGSFMPTESGEIRSRSGGISVSLASPDGRVIGGGLAGLLVAACPMQVVVASFLPQSQYELMTKKPRPEPPSINVQTSAAPISGIDLDEAHSIGTARHGSGGAPSTRGDHWMKHTAGDSRNTTDINVPLHAG